MPIIQTKSPAENYASRTAEAKPNIGHPGPVAERTAVATRATAELAVDQTTVISPIPAAR